MQCNQTYFFGECVSSSKTSLVNWKLLVIYCELRMLFLRGGHAVLSFFSTPALEMVISKGPFF